jgi:hypothetical protein
MSKVKRSEKDKVRKGMNEWKKKMVRDENAKDMF